MSKPLLSVAIENRPNEPIQNVIVSTSKFQESSKETMNQTQQQSKQIKNEQIQKQQQQQQQSALSDSTQEGLKPFVELAPPKAIKHDDNKPQLSLLSSIWLKRVVKALDSIKIQVINLKNTDTNIHTYAYNQMFENSLEWNDIQSTRDQNDRNHSNTNSLDRDKLALASGWMMIVFMDLKTPNDLYNYFENKSGYQLLFDKWLILVTRVLMFGARKYNLHNWRLGFNLTRLYDAFMRHLLAYNSGELIDPESGLSHLGHASCGMMFTSELEEIHPELDDRYRMNVNK